MTRRAVFVTGAAAGIGRAIALRFDAEGCLVGAYDVDADGLGSLAAKAPGVVTGMLDVRDVDAWRSRLADFASESGGRLDVLVNNAGVMRSGPFAETPLEELHLIADVNVKGVLNGCHLAYEYLRTTEGAHVVNLCSASAIYGQAELAAYSASKFAVRGLTEALDLEWAGDDITVRAVWPLFVATSMTEGLDTASTRSLGVHLTPDDVADEVYHVVRPRRLPRTVHHAVGRQAKLMLVGSKVAPDWVVREINRRISTEH